LADIDVFIVDDSPSFVRSVTRLLEQSNVASVLGSASSAEDGLEQAAALRPDLVLMDISLPGMSGIEATHRVKQTPGAPPVIIVTMHDEPEYREAALAAGADGFVVKSELDSDLIGVMMEVVAKHWAEAGRGPRGSET
jgi:DNA-binding NarL/FixJ family response regulator